MADDPRLGRFLASWERDQNEGITIRAVHNRLVGHVNRYEGDQKEVRDRLKAVETRVEVEGERDAEARAADATGPQMIPTPQAFPVPAMAVMPVAMAPAAVPHPHEKHSGFWRSAKSAAMRHGGTAIGGAAITLLITWMAGRGCQAAQAVEGRPASSATARP